MVFTQTKRFGRYIREDTARYSVRNPNVYTIGDLYRVFSTGNECHPFYYSDKWIRWYDDVLDAEFRAMELGQIHLSPDMSVYQLELRLDHWSKTESVRALLSGVKIGPAPEVPDVQVPELDDPPTGELSPSTFQFRGLELGSECTPVYRAPSSKVFTFSDVDVYLREDLESEDEEGYDERFGNCLPFSPIVLSSLRVQAGGDTKREFKQKPKEKPVNRWKATVMSEDSCPPSEPTGWVSTPQGRQYTYGKLENQAGSNSFDIDTSAISAFVEGLKNSHAGFRKSHCETILLQVVHMATLTTWTQFATAALCFANTMLTRGVAGLIMDIVSNVQGLRMGVQASESDVFDNFKLLRSNFDLFKQSPLFESMHKIIALSVSGAVVDTDFAVRYPRFYKRVVESVKLDKFDALDIVQLVLESTYNVWNVARDVMISGSIAPIFGAASINAIEQEHAAILARHPRYLNGTYRDAFGEEPLGFLGRVTAHRDGLRTLHMGARDHERSILSRYVKEITEIHASVTAHMNRRTSRVMPFGIKLYGTTGVGKSAVTTNMVRDLLRIAGLPHEDRYVAYVNTLEKFMSTVQNHTLAVVLDDLSQTKPDRNAGNDMAYIIELLNNASNPVVKADLADKGCVFHNSWFVFATTNVAGLHAAAQVSEPSAILRRFRHIEMRVASDYVLRGNHAGELEMLDPARIAELGANGAQEYRVLDYVPLARRGRPAAAEGVIPVVDGEVDTGVFKPVSDWVTYSRLMELLAPEVRAHFERQRAYLESNDVNVALPLCEHGFTTAPQCHLCAAEPAVQAGCDSEVSDMTDVSVPSELTMWSRLSRRIEIYLEQDPINKGRADDIYAYIQTQMFLEEFANLLSMITTEGLRVHVMREYHAMYQAHILLRGILEITTPIPDNCLWPPRLSESVVRVGGYSPMVPVMERVRQFWYKTYAQTTYQAYHASGVVQRRFIEAFETCRSFCLPDEPMRENTFVVRALDRFGLLETTERLFLCNPRCTLAFCLVGLPSLVMWIAAVITWMCGVHLGLSIASVAAVSFVATYLATHHLIKIFRARLRSFTIEEFRSRCRDVVNGRFGSVVIAMVAAIPLYLVASRLYSKVKAPTARSQPYEWDTQGGVLTMPPDPTVRRVTWEKRDLISYNYAIGKARTMTSEQIVRQVERALFVMHVHYTSGKIVASQALMVRTDFALMPSHNLWKATGERSAIDFITMRQTTADKGAVFTFRVGESNVVRLPGDMALVYVATGGTMTDIVGHITDGPERLESVPVIHLSRDLDSCEMQSERFLAHHQMIRCDSYDMAYPGHTYMRQTNTYVGMCGSIVLVDERFPRIVGLHVQGVTGTPRGCSSLLSRSHIIDAIAQLRGGLVNVGPCVDQYNTRHHFPKGREVDAELGPLCERSVVREALPGTAILPMGTLKNYPQVRPKSELVISPFSEHVVQCCGMERSHEPPSNLGKATVEKAKLHEACGTTQLDPDIHALAVKDRRDELVRLVMATPALLASLRPLTEHEAVNGVVGCHTINRLNMSTSAGWPYTGSKRQFMEPDPTDAEPDAVRLVDSVREELESLENFMGTLQRPNFVFKTGQKDEAVKIGKKKVRVFEASPVVFTILTRKFFLPVMRVYGAFPLETGSAVGINAAGVDWNWLQRHLATYSPDKTIVGDWVHFDMSEAYQEMMAVFGNWIHIAQELGDYSEVDINIMWVIAQEICRHYSIFKGDLIAMEGTNPSGNALTVFVNNEVNAVRMRCAFYAQALDLAIEKREVGDFVENTVPPISFAGYRIASEYRAGLDPLVPGLSGRFADYVGEAYYGDDFILAPKWHHVPWFTQFSLELWFGKQGKQITSPNKGPITSEYTDWDDVDFLKRGFRWDGDLMVFLAPLAMTSIYKPMFVVPRVPAYNLAFHYGDLIKSATRELFQHGQEEFEARVGGLVALSAAVGADVYLGEYEGFEYSYHRDKYVSESMEHMSSIVQIMEEPSVVLRLPPGCCATA